MFVWADFMKPHSIVPNIVQNCVAMHTHDALNIFNRLAPQHSFNLLVFQFSIKRNAFLMFSSNDIGHNAVHNNASAKNSTDFPTFYIAFCSLLQKKTCVRGFFWLLEASHFLPMCLASTFFALWQQKQHTKEIVGMELVTLTYLMNEIEYSFKNQLLSLLDAFFQGSGILMSLLKLNEFGNFCK